MGLGIKVLRLAIGQFGLREYCSPVKLQSDSNHHEDWRWFGKLPAALAGFSDRFGAPEDDESALFIPLPTSNGPKPAPIQIGTFVVMMATVMIVAVSAAARRVERLSRIILSQTLSAAPTRLASSPGIGHPMSANRPGKDGRFSFPCAHQLATSDPGSSRRLTRELGLPGAVMMGLGSIVGTGVFVSLGVAAGIAGPAVIIAVAIGAGVATCNGLSSAQLAANHAVSGGTYEYGYKYLAPTLGFTAGWMFLVAKSMSAATAALEFAGYLLGAFGIEAEGLLVPVALGTVALLTGVVLSGMRRSNTTNITIVSVTLGSLIFFVVAGSPTALSNGTANFAEFFDAPEGGGGLRALLYASALMFVAYTGYGRIATLGEEVQAPRTTIPRAIIVTLVVTMTLYVAVALVGIGSVGAGALSAAADQDAAPLVVAAQSFGVPGASQILSFGAVTAMLGVLLNLILGLSRVLLAMGRRADVPRLFGRVNEAGTTPVPAVLAVGIGIAALTLIGDVKTTWSFSAFTVLVYYALTNLSALYIPSENQLYPYWIAATGLAACGGLTFFVTPWIWITGLGLIVVGLAWHGVARWQRGGATGS